MYLYNITYKVENDAAEMWLNWMQLVHVSKVVQAGNFLGHRICKLMGVDESDGITYAVQYMVPDVKTYNTYQKNFAKVLGRELLEKFPNQYVEFSTVLKILE